MTGQPGRMLVVTSALQVAEMILTTDWPVEDSGYQTCPAGLPRRKPLARRSTVCIHPGSEKPGAMLTSRSEVHPWASPSGGINEIPDAGLDVGSWRWQGDPEKEKMCSPTTRGSGNEEQRGTLA